MKKVLPVAILALAIAASSCSGGASSPTSPTGVVAPAGFTLTTLIVGIPDGGASETGAPVNGGTVSVGTGLKYSAYFTGPDASGLTITFRTFNGVVLVNERVLSASSYVGGETRTTILHTPMVSGTYKVEVSITSAPAPVSATFEVR